MSYERLHLTPRVLHLPIQQLNDDSSFHVNLRQELHPSPLIQPRNGLLCPEDREKEETPSERLDGMSLTTRRKGKANRMQASD